MEKNIWRSVRVFRAPRIRVVGFFVAKHAATESRGAAWKTYIQALCAAVLVTVIFAFTDGQPSRDFDGNWIEGYEVTDKARVEHALLMFIILLVPALFGVYRGHAARRT